MTPEQIDEEFELNSFEEREAFTKVTISVYRALGGWQTQLTGYFETDNTWDVIQTGFGPYDTKEEAHREAKEWAEAEGIAYVETGGAS